jgi:UDP-glucose 4-epimerase
MAHYLVTGGAGFIGSHITEELVRRGHQVRVADNLSTGKRSNLDHVSGVEFLEGDLADLDVAHRAVRGCDYVLHQAAIPSVPRSVKDPIGSNRANVDATVTVLVASRDAGVKRLVFAGSSSAYGNTPTLPKREDMPSSPLSPYALQKVVGEQYLQLFGSDLRVRVRTHREPRAKDLR